MLKLPHSMYCSTYRHCSHFINPVPITDTKAAILTQIIKLQHSVYEHIRYNLILYKRTIGVNYVILKRYKSKCDLQHLVYRQLGGLVVKMLICCARDPGFILGWRTKSFSQISSAKSQLDVIGMKFSIRGPLYQCL